MFSYCYLYSIFTFALFPPAYLSPFSFFCPLTTHDNRKKKKRRKFPKPEASPAKSVLSIRKGTFLPPQESPQIPWCPPWANPAPAVPAGSQHHAAGKSVLATFTQLQNQIKPLPPDGQILPTSNVILKTGSLMKFPVRITLLWAPAAGKMKSVHSKCWYDQAHMSWVWWNEVQAGF